MRWLKRILKALLGIVGLLLLAVVGLFAWAVLDRTDSFFVENAELEVPSLFDRERARMVSGRRIEYSDVIHRVIAHRVKSGKGVVLGYRWYTNGSPMAIDDEGYKKITVWLPERYINSSGTVNIDDESGVMVIYSVGGSAWPRTGCHRKVETGSLDIEWSGKRIRARIEGPINYLPDPIFKGLECEPGTLSEEFSFNSMEMNDLTPWLGVRGEHIYSETYR